MGGILDWVGEFVGGLIGLPFFWFDKVFGGNFFTSLIESIMNFLGFEDEDIYDTSVIAVRVFNEDLYNKVQQDLHLEYMTKGYGSIDYSNNFAKTGDNQFGRYYRTGKWDYMDYLPTGQINAVSLDTTQIKTVLEDIENTGIFIVDIVSRTPTDEVWVKYQLQQLYDYNVGDNTLKYTDNKWYNYDSVYYNSSTNKFDVTLTTITKIDVKVYKTTMITITPIDSTHDNKNTFITTDTLYVEEDTGYILYRTFITDSNTDEIVLKNTAFDSYNSEFISQSSIDIPASIVIVEISNHINHKYYFVEYTVTDIGRLKYWLYDPTTEQYPSITNPNQKSVNFELFPVVMMRNAYFNVVDYDKNKVNGKSRPPSITKERYKQTHKMLKSVGVDLDDTTKGFNENPDIDNIQDAFFLLGVSPSDDNPVVSKYLYEMFDAVYDTSPFDSPDTAYSMVFKEDPFNDIIVWNAQDVIIQKEKIGLMGDCKHYISKSNKEYNLTIKKQITKTTVKVISIKNFKAVSVIRGSGFSNGTELKLDNKNLIIPLAIPVVARLTLMEKTALLGRSVHLLFYAVQHTHLEWYETKKFTEALQIAMIVIMVIVTVIVTVCTWGSGTGPTITAFSAAMAALEAVAIAVAVQLALKLIATFVDDPALKAALSLVVMAVGVYFSMGISFGMNGLTALQLSACAVNAASMYMGDVVEADSKEFDIKQGNFNTKLNQRSSEQEKITKGMNTGITAFDTVSLSTNMDFFDYNKTNRRNTSASSLSPAQFYYLATNQAAYNYDLMYSGLYDNTVHDFVSNRLTLGMVGE